MGKKNIEFYHRVDFELTYLNPDQQCNKTTVNN